MSSAQTSIESCALSLRLPAVRRLGVTLAQEAQRQHLTTKSFSPRYCWLKWTSATNVGACVE